MKKIVIDFPNRSLFEYLKIAALSGLSFISALTARDHKNSSQKTSFNFFIKIEPRLTPVEAAVRYLESRSRKSGQIFHFKIGGISILPTDKNAAERIIKELNSTRKSSDITRDFYK